MTDIHVIHCTMNLLQILCKNNITLLKYAITFNVSLDDITCKSVFLKHIS